MNRCVEEPAPSQAGERLELGSAANLLEERERKEGSQYHKSVYEATFIFPIFNRP